MSTLLLQTLFTQIIAEQEQSEPADFPSSADLLVEPETDDCPSDAYTQTRVEVKSTATQTRQKNLSKGKMLCQTHNLVSYLQLYFSYNYFILSLSGVQTKPATKSEGVQCTLLKDLFVTSTPCQSENDETDSEGEEMDAEDPLFTLDSDDSEDQMDDSIHE